MTRRLGAVLVLLLAFLWLPALPASAATATVTIGSTLNPKSLTVAPGTTVTWRNAHSERHRIRTTSAPVELDSNDLEPGDSWSFTFSTAGTYRYVDHRDEDDSAYWGTVTVSSGSSGGSGGGSSPPPSGGGGTTSPTAPSSATVSMAGRVFSPSSVRVAAGGTVTFVNNDDDEHTVTASDGSFDSGVMNAGGRWARRFASAGTFRYFCAIHPDMTGTVTVPTSSGSVPPPAPSAPRPPSGGAGGSGGTGGSGGGAGPAVPPSRPGSARVNVVDFAYTPARLSVHVGDTVSFVNVGRAPHTVTAPGFGTPMLAAGATWRTTVRAVGRISYLCAFHPQMTGVLEVLPATAKLPAPVAAAPAPPLAAPSASVAAPAAPSAPPPSVAPPSSAAGSDGEQRETRTVAATSMWRSPIVAWTFWGGLGLVAFLSVAWWRGREPVADPG